jgi:hypothetical protein
MTDEQLIKYLGIKGEPFAQAMIDGLRPGHRAAYERMFELQNEVDRWMDGDGEKPSGVLLDFPKQRRRRW